MTVQNVLYRITLVFFISAFIALLAVTPIDTIHQSQTSGQFWDAIIIVVAYVLTVLSAVLLYLIRIWHVRRSLSDIPRRYMVRDDDIAEMSFNRIRSELARCAWIAHEVQKPRGRISHAGLRNPEIAEGVVAPYEEIVVTSNNIIEKKARTLHPSFARQKGMALREYLILLESYKLIDESANLEYFIGLYERARFSGKPMEEQEFNEYMEACFQMIYSIKLPEGVPETAHSRAISENFTRMHSRDNSSTMTGSPVIYPFATRSSVSRYSGVQPYYSMLPASHPMESTPVSPQRTRISRIESNESIADSVIIYS
jgi:hypothetical protein